MVLPLQDDRPVARIAGNDHVTAAGLEKLRQPRIPVPGQYGFHRSVQGGLVPVQVDLAQRIGIGARGLHGGILHTGLDHPSGRLRRLPEFRTGLFGRGNGDTHGKAHAQGVGKTEPGRIAAVEQQVEPGKLAGLGLLLDPGRQNVRRLVQVVEEAAVDLLLAVGHVFAAAVGEMAVYHRPVVVRHAVHGQDFEYLRYGIERRHLLACRLFQPVNLGHDVGIGKLPHGAVPTVLQVVIGVMAATLQRFGIVHIAREHIRIEVLRHLERPVLALAEIVVEINPLLNDLQAVSEAVVVGLEIPVRNPREVVVHIPEIPRAGTQKDCAKCGEQIYVKALHDSQNSSFMLKPMLRTVGMP